MYVDCNDYHLQRLSQHITKKPTHFQINSAKGSLALTRNGDSEC